MKRVSAYCRVSTDRDDQANSLASQKRYFEDYISKTPDWELIEIYIEACDIIEPTQETA